MQALRSSCSSVSERDDDDVSLDMNEIELLPSETPVPLHPVYGKLTEFYPLEMLDLFWAQFNIQSLHDWQIECLTLPRIKEGANLIFSAPTSAGKSIVCDLLYFRTLMQNRGKCVIFVLPFVSLIAEKEKHLSQLCEQMGFRFASLHSHKRVQFSDDEDCPNLILCTVEKANQLLNRIIE